MHGVNFVAPPSRPPRAGDQNVKGEITGTREGGREGGRGGRVLPKQ